MSSFQVDSVCYNSESDALAAMASRMFGTGQTSQGVYQYYSYVDGANIVTRTSLGTESIQTPVLQDCHLFTAADASLYCSAVLVLMVTAAKFRVARSVANGSDNP